MLKVRVAICGQTVSLDGLFGKFLRVLNEATIHKKIRLRHPDTGADLSGYRDASNEEIFLCPAPKGVPGEDTTKVLVHELCHYVFPKLPEDGVIFLEEFLWCRLNEKQKRMLGGYIPKKYSKEQPS